MVDQHVTLVKSIERNFYRRQGQHQASVERGKARLTCVIVIEDFLEVEKQFS